MWFRRRFVHGLSGQFLQVLVEACQPQFFQGGRFAQVGFPQGVQNQRAGEFPAAPLRQFPGRQQMTLGQQNSGQQAFLVVHSGSGRPFATLAAFAALLVMFGVALAAVVYPSSTLHRVEPVTRGERLAAVTWVQSLVRDPARRELLFDLDTARRALFEQSGKSREFDLLSRSLANLLRMWAEP